jgi:hypothetical protein
LDLGDREVTRGWRKLHNEELHNFTKFESELFKEDGMGKTIYTCTCSSLVGKPEGKNSLGDPDQEWG